MNGRRKLEEKFEMHDTTAKEEEREGAGNKKKHTTTGRGNENGRRKIKARRGGGSRGKVEWMRKEMPVILLDKDLVGFLLFRAILWNLTFPYICTQYTDYFLC